MYNLVLRILLVVIPLLTIVTAQLKDSESCKTPVCIEEGH